jgi:hypothetical protein
LTNIKITNTEKEKRHQVFIHTYLKMAEKSNFNEINRNRIMKELNITRWYFDTYGGGIKQIERDALNYAIENRMYKIVLQILANNHSFSKKITPQLKKEAAAILLK